MAAKMQHHVLCPEFLLLIFALVDLDARPSSFLGLPNLQECIRYVGTPNCAFGESTAWGVGDELVAAE